MATYVANGNISQCVFVKEDTSVAGGGRALNASTGDKMIGVSYSGSSQAPFGSLNTQDSLSSDLLAQVNQEFGVHLFSEGGAGFDQILLLIGSGGCVPGDALKSDSNGAGVVTVTTNQWVGAVALQTAASGDYARVRLISPALY